MRSIKGLRLILMRLFIILAISANALGSEDVLISEPIGQISPHEKQLIKALKKCAGLALTEGVDSVSLISKKCKADVEILDDAVPNLSVLILKSKIKKDRRDKDSQQQPTDNG